MNAVGAGRESDVGSGIDQKASYRLLLTLRCSCLVNGANGIRSEFFQLSRAQILFAELNVVDAGACSLAYLGE